MFVLKHHQYMPRQRIQRSIRNPAAVLPQLPPVLSLLLSLSLSLISLLSSHPIMLRTLLTSQISTCSKVVTVILLLMTP